jgi:hypothetical protein
MCNRFIIVDHSICASEHQFLSEYCPGDRRVPKGYVYCFERTRDIRPIMQGLNTTPLHGHAALFGVYGMLDIGLMLICLGVL